MKNDECLRELAYKFRKQLWGLILSGGDGQRLREFTKNIYGYYRPKQYCAFIGNRSLIKHTLDRALSIIPSERIITIVNQYHHQFVIEEIGTQPPETIITQPCNRDTGAGILFPLFKIYKQDPDSIIAIFPSDHFIYPEDRFMKYVNDAYNFVRTNINSIVLLGVQPDRIETGYGWIEPGDCISNNCPNPIHRINKFWEKPGAELAKNLWSNRCLWNTFVIIGSCKLLIKNIQEYIPEVYYLFEKIFEFFGTHKEHEAINNLFLSLPAINFSHSVLEKNVQQLCVMKLTDVYWNDWGEEKSILYDVKKFCLRLKYPHRTIKPKSNYRSKEALPFIPGKQYVGGIKNSHSELTEL